MVSKVPNFFVISDRDTTTPLFAQANPPSCSRPQRGSAHATLPKLNDGIRGSPGNPADDSFRTAASSFPHIGVVVQPHPKKSRLQQSIMSLFAYQPFKAFFVLGALALNLSRLPFWILKYALIRQHPTWSFRQALVLRITRAFIHTVSVIRMRTPLPLTPGAEKDQFVVIKKRAEDAGKFKGPMLTHAQDVQPVDIGATWYPSPLSAQSKNEDALVVLHIHGGAYVIGDGRTEASGYLANALLKHTPATHVLSPQYRLSTLPASKTSNPFPAALQDALTSYLYLLRTLNIPAEKIVLSGDSAGANCAIALLRYIVEYGDEVGVPQPSAALLWSPWLNPTDVTDSFMHENPHFNTDYIHPAFTAWGTRAFAGINAGPSPLANNPYVNAMLKPFKTPVPLFVNIGGAEVLYFDGKEWAGMMEKEGNEVVLDVQEGVCHDVYMIAKLVGFQKEGREMGKRCGEWLKHARK
ncbi:hypothetical protein N0V90_004230 [Kalmusia sp. IMI 367209]|nr:hypothetical protein N0V90_004230 [Kalmusia sp. IMI 367209]